MIPVRLTLHNFLCYGAPQEVDFRGIRLACLAGDNGAGKTALLDAITWALWGKCRAKTEDEVVQLGQTEAEVELDFVAGEQLYRVIRKRRRTGNRPGSTVLELQAAYGEGFRSESESSVRATERKIVDLLRMDYDTFVTSAFLIQGKADLFTTKTPDERKKVLSDILGLDRYEKLEIRSRELMRLRESDIKGIERELTAMQEKLDRRPEIEGEHVNIVDALQETAQQIQSQQQTVAGLGERKRSLDETRRRLAQSQAQLQRAEQQRQQAQSLMAKEQASIEQSQAVLRDGARIQAGYDELLTTRESVRKATQQAERWNELERQRIAAQNAIDRVLLQIRNREETLVAETRKLDELRNKAPTLAEEVTKLEKQESVLDEERQKLASWRQQEQDALSSAQVAKEAVARVKEEITQMDNKLKTLELGEQAACPVCGQPLGKEERVALLASIRDERKTRLEFGRAQQQSALDYTKLAQTHKQESQRLEAHLRTKEGGIRTRMATVQSELVRAQDAENGWSEARKQLDEIQEQLDSKSFATTEREGLAKLEQSISLLGYDKEAYEALKHQLDDLEPFEARYREFIKAEQALAQATASLERAAEQLETWTEQCTEFESDVTSLQKQISEDGDLEPQLAAAESVLQATERRQAGQRQALGAIEQQLEYLTDLAIERQKKETESKNSILEYSIYKDLADAFSRRGVQALIIDSVLPELEQEANDLLARMTGNRMSLSISTQRETQKGTVRETLDIRIADEFGTRSYEMFSGGEAFRINFALRIALSKLLARRAGAPLRTLIIDEGFGTQDASGRERLIETLSTVQDDFDCILAITHIDEMRDAFPVRIVVEKGMRGSSVSVAA